MQLGNGLVCISLTVLYNGWPLITDKSLVSWPLFLEDYSGKFNYKGSTTRKKLINDVFTTLLKNYNDASLKRHGPNCLCICLDTMTLIISIILY